MNNLQKQMKEGTRKLYQAQKKAGCLLQGYFQVGYLTSAIQVMAE